MLIWTEGYQPFIVGGDVNAPLGVEVSLEGGESIDIGQGIRVYEVKFPDGRTAIVEATTGAIVGSDLQTVKDDLSQADSVVVQRQLQAAQQRRLKVRQLPMAEFLRIWPKQ